MTGINSYKPILVLNSMAIKRDCTVIVQIHTFLIFLYCYGRDIAQLLYRNHGTSAQIVCAIYQLQTHSYAAISVEFYLAASCRKRRDSLTGS